MTGEGRSPSPETVCVVPYCARQGRADCPYPQHPRKTAPARTPSPKDRYHSGENT